MTSLPFVDDARIGMQTAALPTRGFMASGPSNPLAGLDLISAPEAAKILGRTGGMLYQQRRRGKLVVAPVVILEGNRMLFSRAEVERAAELLKKPQEA